jgi:hypothetical protein
MGWLKHMAKKASNVFHKASNAGKNLFDKGEVGGHKLFGKGSIGSKILSDTSKGLNQAAGVAQQVGKQVGKFADAASPVLGAMGPVGEGILAGAHGISSGLGGVASTARLASGATKQKNYSGGAGHVAANILERAKSVHDAGSGISFV